MEGALPRQESIPAGAARDPSVDPSLQIRPLRPVALDESAATIESFHASKHLRVTQRWHGRRRSNAALTLKRFWGGVDGTNYIKT